MIYILSHLMLSYCIIQIAINFFDRVPCLAAGNPSKKMDVDVVMIFGFAIFLIFSSRFFII